MAASDDSTWQPACNIKDLSEGRGSKFVLKDGSVIAIFNINKQLYAIGNRCCHGKGQLFPGDIEELGACEGGVHPNGSSVGGLCVRCPKHRKKFGDGLWFSLQDGMGFVKELTDDFSPIFRVPVYRTRVDADSGLISVQLVEQSKTGAMHWISVRLHKIQSKFGFCGRKSRPHVAVGSEPSNANVEINQISPRPANSQWKFVSKTSCNHNTRLFHFQFPNIAGHPGVCDPSIFEEIGKMWHVALIDNCHNDATKATEVVSRDYTPVSTEEDWSKGSLVLLIKIYPDGIMTQHLEKMEIGAMVTVSHPRTTLKLPLLPQHRQQQHDENKTLHVAMIAGGTGITPMIQLMNQVCVCPSSFGGYSRVDAKLLYFNRTEDDVLMKNELQQLIQQGQGNIQVVLSLTRPNDGRSNSNDSDTLFKHEVGRFSKEMAARYFDCTVLESTDFVFVVSGPDGMWESTLTCLKELQFQEDQCIELEA